MTYSRPKESFEEPLAEMPELKWYERWLWQLVIGSGLVCYALIVGAWWIWEVWR